jgi:regulator of sirC expression with transglutaminase-like and TPR domain
MSFTDLSLDEAALVIAERAQPGLDPRPSLDELDRIAGRCAHGSLDSLHRRLYVDEGFAGNAVDYYDPANSFLNVVLDRRTGIPISLAVVAIEAGRRAGVGLVGVGLPGHFLVRLADDEDTFLDPFDGRVLDRAGCREIYDRLGSPAPFDDRMLAPVSRHHMLRRMLANLERIYASRADATNLAWVRNLGLQLQAPLN